ncbi:MAG: hypothetical protein N2036_10430 [Bryobacteraceae bacterium]|nr:hypothetical protein [Bryobacteraceae bacterium]MCX7604478.1 hypothetical protein [Bryobacteraceae bacterium]
MRTSLLALIAALLWNSGARAEGLEALSGQVTLVMEADRPLPSKAIQSMREEMARLFGASKVRLQWADRGETGLGFEAEGIVVLRLKGECRMPDLPMPPDERGPLAWTHVSEGVVLPFSEIDCASVTRAAQSALRGGERSLGDVFLGRALARVAAHELVHILLQRKEHVPKGIFRRGLTARELVEQFHEEDERGRIVLDAGGKPAS